MNRSLPILLITFMLTLASAVSAQIPVTCGIVDIDGPSKVDPGTPIVFKVRVTGMLHTSKPEFKWNVSVGTIIKGQGTDEIPVDTAGLGGLDLSVMVELIDAPLGCRSSASRTTQFTLPPRTRCSFDEYGDIEFEGEKARLDNFAIQISNDPQSSGLILMYAGQKTFRREVAYRLDRARSYLVIVRGIDSNRIVTVDCGFIKELATTLWVVPREATFPECNTVSQIPLSEVKFTKPPPKSSKKRR